MSEEEAVEENEQVEQTEEASDNKIFNALYNAAEETEEEPREEFKPPANIHSALHEIESEEPEAKTEEAPEEQEKVVDTKKPKPKHKVKRKIVDPEYKQQPMPVASAPNQQIDPYVENLLPEEKEAYEIATWASRNDPEHKDLNAKYLKFFKAHNELLEKNKEDYEFSDSVEYKNFIKSQKPQVNLKNIERNMWTAEAKNKAMQEMAPQLDQVRREQLKIKGEPVARAGMQKTKTDLISAIPGNFAESLKKDGVENFAKQNPLEAQIINKHLTSAQNMAGTFHQIVNDIEDYNESNPAHAALSRFIQDAQDKFIKTGRTQRNGKTFIRRERMPTVPAQDRGKYYTFSDEDVLSLIVRQAKHQIHENIDGMNKAIQKGGWKKEGVAPAQPSQPAPTASSMPKALTPSKGVSAPAAGEVKQENPILNLLGL